jgi:hypothetical protein
MLLFIIEICNHNIAFSENCIKQKPLVSLCGTPCRKNWRQKNRKLLPQKVVKITKNKIKNNIKIKNNLKII